jgi:hypothetical protein
VHFLLARKIAVKNMEIAAQALHFHSSKYYVVASAQLVYRAERFPSGFFPAYHFIADNSQKVDRGD